MSQSAAERPNLRPPCILKASGSQCEQFRRLVAEKNIDPRSPQYSDESTWLISYALDLAGAYNSNEVTSRRVRKFDKEPYITHTLDMASEATRMRLHPTIVAACLLHDVAEDVRLGNLRSPNDWMQFFDKQFEGYEDKKRLMRILRAELKTETLSGKFTNENEKKQVVEHYMSSPIGRTAVQYLRDLRGNADLVPTDTDKEKIAEVIFDLNRLFTDSFVESPDGKKEFDPSVLVVKILDTWQNLKTPGFWKNQLQNEDKDAQTVAKLIRARTLTNVAEFLGMRKVASEMMMHLSTIHDTQNIDKPLLHELISGEEQNYLRRKTLLSSRLADADEIAQRIAFEGMKTEKVAPIFQSPWAVTDTTKASGEPNITFLATTKDSMSDIKLADIYGTFGLNLLATQSINSNSLRAAIYALCGRETYHFMLSKPEGAIWQARGKSWNLIVESGVEPRIIDLCMSTKFDASLISNSPEYGLFHPDVCKYMGPSG